MLAGEVTRKFAELDLQQDELSGARKAILRSLGWTFQPRYALWHKEIEGRPVYAPPDAAEAIELVLDAERCAASLSK